VDTLTDRLTGPAVEARKSMPDVRLAIDGGPPAYSRPCPSWPLEDDDVRQALIGSYCNGTWGRYEGPNLERLIQSLAVMHSVPYVFPCCSGTVAIELALRGLCVEPGHEVILAGYDFAGNFRAVETVGAVPVLVDVVPDTWCLDVDQVESAVSSRTRAVVVSHLHGGFADMRRLRAIADQHQLSIVEDACQSPGASIQGRLAGTWGDAGVWSFGGSKLLTAGRGGAILTRDESVWQRIKVFCERGNHAFPLSELQAAVLIPQLAKLGTQNARRRDSVTRLLAKTSQLATLSPLATPPADTQPCYYKVAWRYEPPAGEWPRERFLAALRAEGISIDEGFRGFLRRGSRSRRHGSLEHSAAAAERTVLLHHPVLLEPIEAIDQVADALVKVSHAATSSLEAGS
jgi:dTDP-4-amino-4,6-dideoxygalactose transaminase